jgi:lipopolysaccharide/colanic/teichoic acid biosynthesis glycosyltransferase
MLKFRTMRPGGDDAAHRALIRRELDGLATPVDGSFKLTSDDRVTKLGNFLRRTSLDELPQLINVIRGEMAIVGPRPALAWEHEMFPEDARRRVDVRPGLTGLWQVSGRSTLTTPEMLELDLVYVQHRSLALDLHILARTVGTLARRDGAR